MTKRNIILGVILVLLCAWVFYSTRTNTVPTPEYVVVESGAGFEVREYGVYSIVETRVSAPYKQALQEGFERLSSYIEGNNSTGEVISMTRPILIDREDAQERNILGDGVGLPETYRIAFIMPTARTLDSLPEPNDVRLMKRIVPPHTVFVKNIHCIWGCLKEGKQEKIIEKAEDKGFIGDNVIYARYALPWSMPFLVNNELWLSVE